ncbi:MAG: hypothetical protein ACYTKD_32020 [Planctomycetota bacterium]|jgi:hypothetical protein
MEQADQAFKISGIFIAAAGVVVMIGSSVIGGLIVVVGLALAWRGVRLSNQQKPNGPVRPLLWHAEWATHNLQNAEIAGPDAVQELHKRELAWIGKVVAEMESRGCAESDISSVRVLGTYQRRGLNGINDEHRKFRDEIAERIERLRDAAKRIEGGK